MISTTFYTRKTSFYVNFSELLQEISKKLTFEYQTLPPHRQAGQLQPYAGTTIHYEVYSVVVPA